MSRVHAHRGHRGATDDWITPREIVSALGCFDLDPCASERQPWPTARKMLTVKEDGLAQAWEGRVWLNPPYGPEAEKWLRRLAEHGDGIALIFARTETSWFFDSVWGKASAVLFLRGRLHFHRPSGERAKGNAGGPSVLVAYDHPEKPTQNALALLQSKLDGYLVDITPIEVVWQGWRQVVLVILIKAGGALGLAEIYSRVEKVAPSTNRFVRAKVRQTLYRHEGEVFCRDGANWRAA